jgi:hypothetical protein
VISINQNVLDKLDHAAIAAAGQSLAGTPLLVVAGPSGGGKSTFIDALKNDELPGDVAAQLPAEAKHWPVFDAHHLFKRGLDLSWCSAQILAASGAILHYDIVFLRRFALDYDDDPAFVLFDRPRDITVVSVEPAPEALQRQFYDRRSEQRNQKALFSNFWGDFVRGPARRAFKRLGGLPVTDFLYEDLAWLSGCYAEWHAFVERWLAGKANSKTVRVEPLAVPAAGAGSFRLISVQSRPRV